MKKKIKLALIFVAVGLMTVVSSCRPASVASNVSVSGEIAGIAQWPCRYTERDFEFIRWLIRRDKEYDSCAKSYQDELEIDTLFGNTGHGEYRFFYLKKKATTPTEFIIVLPGGPRFETLSFAREDFVRGDAYGLAASSNAGLIVPDYLGTFHRSNYPDADIRPAADEIVGIIRRLRKLHPQSQISLVGYSSGGLVALASLMRIKVRTIIVAPPIASLHDLLTNTTGTDLPDNAKTATMRFMRYQKGSEKLEHVRTTWYEQTEAFSGVVFKKDLATQVAELPKAHIGCLSVVIGNRDRRIKISKLAEFRKQTPNVPVVILEGIGHQFASRNEAIEAGAVVSKLVSIPCR